MNAREMIRDVAGDIARDIVFQEGLKPAWSLDFTQGAMPGGLTFARSSGANYFNSAGILTTAAADMPRLDYHPVTLKPMGLLIEESRTNYLLNSAAPVTQTVSLGTGTYTLSVTGTGSCAAAAGTAAGTGFGTATASGTVTFSISTAGTVVFTVTGSLTRYQCEMGLFATSFISTTTAAATRVTEQCSLPLGGWFNPAEGTLVAEASVGGTGNNRIVVHLDDGTDNNAINHLLTGGNDIFVVRVAGAAQAAISFPATTTGNVVKLAGAYKLNDAQAAKNGALGTPDTTVNLPSGLTTLRLGSRPASQYLNGWIRELAYYPVKLSAAQLASLTS